MKLSELDKELDLKIIEILNVDCKHYTRTDLLNLIKQYMARAVIDTEIQNALFNHDQE